MNLKRNEMKTFKWAGEYITATYSEKSVHNGITYYIFISENGIRYPLTSNTLKNIERK